jgi:hypothetical protein
VEQYRESGDKVNGRLLIELVDGKITIYPITETDEQTRVVLAALLDRIADAVRA